MSKRAPIRLLGPAEVVALLGTNRMQLKRWRDAGTFPTPIAELEIGPVWLAEGVERWAAARREQQAGT